MRKNLDGTSSCAGAGRGADPCRGRCRFAMLPVLNRDNLWCSAGQILTLPCSCRSSESSSAVTRRVRAGHERNPRSNCCSLVLSAPVLMRPWRICTHCRPPSGPEPPASGVRRDRSSPFEQPQQSVPCSPGGTFSRSGSSASRRAPRGRERPR